MTQYRVRFMLGRAILHDEYIWADSEDLAIVGAVAKLRLDWYLTEIEFVEIEVVR